MNFKRKQGEMTELPEIIYLQIYGDEEDDQLPTDEIDIRDVTWCWERIFKTDVRYVIDKRHVPKKRRKSK